MRQIWHEHWKIESTWIVLEEAQFQTGLCQSKVIIILYSYSDGLSWKTAFRFGHYSRKFSHTWEISEISPEYEKRIKSTASRAKFGGTEFVYSRKERFKKKVSGIFDVWGIVTRIRILNIPDEKEGENKSVLSEKAEVVTAKPQKYNDIGVTPAAWAGPKYLLHQRVWNTLGKNVSSSCFCVGAKMTTQCSSRPYVCLEKKGHGNTKEQILDVLIQHFMYSFVRWYQRAELGSPSPVQAIIHWAENVQSFTLFWNQFFQQAVLNF